MRKITEEELQLFAKGAIIVAENIDKVSKKLAKDIGVKDFTIIRSKLLKELLRKRERKDKIEEYFGRQKKADTEQLMLEFPEIDLRELVICLDELKKEGKSFSC